MQEVLEQYSEDGFPVVLPSGSPFTVLHTSEVRYVEERVKLYSAEFKWHNISDVQDVDRIIILELLVYRYGLFLAQEKDYMGETVNEQALRKSVGDYSGELRQLKKQLGMDKSSRDKERGEDSVPAFIERLLQRGKEFGIMRDEQLAKGVELSQQLIALWQLYTNTDEQERRDQRCTAQDIVDWVGSTFKPEFEAVDERFRQNQKMWVGTL